MNKKAPKLALLVLGYKKCSATARFHASLKGKGLCPWSLVNNG